MQSLTGCNGFNGWRRRCISGCEYNSRGRTRLTLCVIAVPFVVAWKAGIVSLKERRNPTDRERQTERERDLGENLGTRLQERISLRGLFFFFFFFFCFRNDSSSRDVRPPRSLDRDLILTAARGSSRPVDIDGMDRGHECSKGNRRREREGVWLWRRVKFKENLWLPLLDYISDGRSGRFPWNRRGKRKAKFLIVE